jgi:hypothetical protein
MNRPAPFARIALLVTLLGVAMPSGAEAQSRRPASTAQSGATLIGGLIGPEFADGDTGLALRFDGQMPITQLAPSLRLDGVLSLGYSYFSDSNRNFDVSTNILKLVPAARFVVPVAPQVGLYGDIGLGFYYASTSVEDQQFGVEDDESGGGITMRFAGGAFFDVTERLRLGTELSVNPFFGDIDDTTVSLLFSLMYRL